MHDGPTARKTVEHIAARVTWGYPRLLHKCFAAVPVFRGAFSKFGYCNSSWNKSRLKLRVNLERICQ